MPPDEYRLDSVAKGKKELGATVTAPESSPPLINLGQPKKKPSLIIGKPAEHDPGQIGPKEQIIELKAKSKRGGRKKTTVIEARPYANRPMGGSVTSSSGRGGMIRHGRRK